MVMMDPGKCLTVLIFLFIYEIKAEEECNASNQAVFNRKCYSFFVNNTQHAVTFKDAAERCRDLNGSSLVIIDTPEVQDFLQTEVTSRKENSSSWRFWTSGRGQYNLWRWVDDGALLGYQGCFTIKAGASGRFPLTSMQSEDITPESCVQGCRAARSDSNDVTQAAIYTASLSTTSISCVCFREDFWKKSTLSDQCTTPCIGDNSTVCGGKSSYSVYSMEGTFTAWNQSVMISSGKAYDQRACAQIHGGSDFQWVPEDCAERHPYICMKAGLTCEEPFKLVVDVCILINENNATWFEAREDCHNKGAELVSIRRKDFEMELTSLLQTRFSYWIGASSYSWKWGNGNDIVYTAWADKEPVISYSTLGVSLRHKDDLNVEEWKTVILYKIYLVKDGYICEKALPPLPTTTTSPTSMPTVVPPLPITTTPEPKTPVNPAYQKGDDSSKIPGAAIGAIIVIAIIVIIAIVVVTVVIRRRKKSLGLATPTGSVTVDGNADQIYSINSGDTRAEPNLYQVTQSSMRNKPVDDAVTYRKSDDKVETPTLERPSSFENPCYRSYEGGLDDDTNDMYHLEMRENLDLAGDLQLYDNNNDGGGSTLYDNNNR